MYNEIYKKLKTLAKIGAILGMVLWGVFALVCIVYGIIIGLGDESGLFLFLIGFIGGLLGILFSWISTWMLYAFADMGENIHALKEKICGKANDYDEEYQLQDPQNFEQF